MKRSKTSKAWMMEHLNDPFVLQAQKDGYRSRAAYKLLEIHAKDHLFKRGMAVVDLGAAPGSWSQAAQRLLAGHGKIFALDILPMNSLAGVHFIEGDFRDEAVENALAAALKNQPIDLVISDMAPNISGQAVTDQARSYHLAELALAFAEKHLKPEGAFLVKVFQGYGYDDFVKAMRQVFVKVDVRKPKSSRDRSIEVYLLGRQMRAPQDFIDTSKEAL